MSRNLARALERLESDGLLERIAGALRTTRRWHGAMALATMRLLGQQAERDLRLPIAAALVEIYGPALRTDDLADMLQALLPIEASELDPELCN